MARYVAFLRSVSPMNLGMPDLKRYFEAAGFSNVRTLLSSDNIVFDASARSETAVACKVEAAMASISFAAFSPSCARRVAPTVVKWEDRSGVPTMVQEGPQD